jgi:hypothetical protein
LEFAEVQPSSGFLEPRDCDVPKTKLRETQVAIEEIK